MSQRMQERRRTVRARGLASALVCALGALATPEASGAPVLVEATALSLRDDATPPLDARKRRLSFRATTSRAPAPNRVVPPAQGGVDDPTVAGGTLYVANAAGSGEIVRIVLPASGWQAQGSPERPRGFVFRDRAPGAPIGQVTVAPDRITLRGNGPGWAYTLDEAQQGRIALRLDLGATAWCAEAPARASGNPPSTLASDQPGRFTGLVKSPPPAACALNRLEVANGYGSGIHPAGSTVHVFAAVRPWNQLVTGWTSDASLLAEPDEWHTTLVMPAADASLAATVVDRPTTLVTSSFNGSTSRPKTVRARIPASPRGLVLFLHGTGGSSGFITGEETFTVALRALESGLGVLATEAEEAVAGDLDGDGKERWDAALGAGNVDFANLNALVAQLRASGTIGPTTPLYALGMSNGGATAISLGAIASAPIAPLFPELRFAAVLSFCADGRAAAVAVTQTPTAWLMCANDDNAEVDNAAAAANSAALAGRGVPTTFAAHPASPLYEERFLRVPGVTLAASRSLAAEMRAAGFVGGDGFFVTPTDDLVAAVVANPALLPSLVALPGAARADVVDQVRAAQAEHQMFSDWAARAVGFLLAHEP